MKKISFVSMLLAIAMIVSIVMYPAFAGAAEPEGWTVRRLSGANRYETACVIADDGWSHADNVVIVNGENYADALVAVPFAFALDAPILPVSGDKLNSAVAAHIASLGVSRAYLVGGESAVSTQIADALSSTCSVTRISGATRFETSVKLADALAQIKGKPGNIFISSSANFPDALAASPVAALTGSPIIYCAPNGELNEAVQKYVSDSDCPAATVLGGTGSVSDSVKDGLQSCGVSSVDRLSGSDRYATAINIYNRYSALFNHNGVALATGESFPDALSGGVLAAKLGYPMLLMSNTRTVDGLHDCIVSSGADELLVFGGTKTISDYALNCLRSNTRMTTTTAATTKTTAKTTSTTASSIGKVTITADSANVRSDAGSSFTLLGTVRKGEVYTCLGQKNASNGVMWYKISYNGKTGYICSAYAQLNGSPGGGSSSNNKYVVSPNYISKYYIVVYTGSQSVVVYGKDKNGKYNQQIKSFTCSTGKDATPTVKGVFALEVKYRWRLMKGDVYCQYATRFKTNYLFHSCIYSKQDASTLSPNSYRNLGIKASHGCVRLCVRDAKWIYDNCPIGTQVNVVTAKGPAGSGVPSIKSASKYYGWDPSDPNPNSPYNK